MELEESPVERARRAPGMRTERELIHAGLREPARRHEPREIRDLRGRLRSEEREGIPAYSGVTALSKTCKVEPAGQKPYHFPGSLRQFGTQVPETAVSSLTIKPLRAVSASENEASTSVRQAYVARFRKSPLEIPDSEGVAEGGVRMSLISQVGLRQLGLDDEDVEALLLVRMSLISQVGLRRY